MVPADDAPYESDPAAYEQARAGILAKRIGDGDRERWFKVNDGPSMEPTRRDVLKWSAVGAVAVAGASYLSARPAMGAEGPVFAPLVYQDAEVTLWRVSAMEKVYPDSPITTSGSSQLTVSAAGNEHEAYQLVVRPASVWSSFSLTFSDLHRTLPDGRQHPRHVIPAEQLSRSRVSYVLVDWTSGAQSLGSGLHPDPLEELPSWDLVAGLNHAVWLSVYVPANTAPGGYDGTVTLWRAGQSVLSLPLHVQVYPFSLPQRPTLHTSGWLQNEGPPNGNTKRIDNFDPAADGQDYQGYYSNMAGHGLDGSNVVKEIVLYRSTDPLDTANFDRVASVMLDEWGFDYSLLPGLGAIYKFPPGVKWKDIPVFTSDTSADLTDEFRSEYIAQCEVIADHLRAHGWLSRSYYPLTDELDTSDALTRARLVNLASAVKQAATDIPIVLTSVPHQDLYPYVDLWIPHMIYWARPNQAPYVGDSKAAILAARKAGQEVWTYHNTMALIDLPSVRSRLLPWILWKEGFPGSLSWWALNHWLVDPWLHAEYRGLAGAGILIYPPRGSLPGGIPVNSIRWELFRDGLEDYEYFTKLTADLAVARQQPPSPSLDLTIRQGEQALAYAESLIHGIPQVFPPNDAPYESDPAAYEQARADIAAAIGQIEEELP